jgi:putative FmdB family regulatory protein
MPLYEYRCGSCGKTIEVMQKFSDTPLTVHEGCGGHLERLISPSALQFKGKGWYVNDYGRGGIVPPNGETKGGAKSESKPASGSESKTTAPSESKTPAKSEKTA